MKRFSFLLIMVLFLSCKEDDKTIEFLVEGLEKADSFLIERNELNMSFLQEAELLNPGKDEKYRVLADLINVYHSKIMDMTQSFCKKDSDIFRPLTKNERDSLQNILVNYKQFLKNEIKEKKLDEVLNGYIDKEIDNLNNCSDLKIYANKLRQMNFIITSFFSFNTTQFSINFKGIKVFTSQNKVLFKKGEVLETYIYPALIGIADFKVIIENDTLNSENNKVIYKRDAIKAGKYKLYGKLIIEHVYSSLNREFPFEINYLVIE